MRAMPDLTEQLKMLRVCSECKCKPVISASKGIVCPICGKSAADTETWNEVNNEKGNSV